MIKKYLILCFLSIFSFSVFGQLSFKSSFALENDFRASHMVIGNFDGNSLKDIAYCNESDKKVVLIYDVGVGTNSTITEFNIDPNPGELHIMKSGDFNNDSKLDLITVNYNSANYSAAQLVILISTGTSFSQKVIDLPLSAYYRSLKVIDFDLDGNTDILVGDTQQMYFFKGNGQGNFVSSSILGLPKNYWLFESADLNSDGQKDFVFVSQDTLFTCLRAGQNYSIKKYNFTKPVALTSLALGDYSGDGLPDVILGSTELTSNGYTLLEYVNTGNGTLAAPLVLITGGLPPSNIDQVDYNGDGRLDILTSSSGYGRDFWLLQNLGNNQFSDQSPTSSYNSFGNSIYLSDLDNDGKKEIVELSTFKYLNFYSLVGGNYQFSKKIVLGTTARNGNVTDLNGDGYADIVSYSPLGGIVSVFYGKASGSFEKPITFSINGEIVAAVTADFNGDGFKDIVYSTNNGAANPVLAVVLTNSSGVLSQTKVIQNVSNAVLTSGDFNNDGKIDFASAQGIFLNDGAANFTPKYFSFSHQAFQIATGNFDSNNSLDLVINDASQNYIGLNDGSGNFSTFTQLPSTKYYYKVKSIKFNSDNLTDLISLNNENGVSIFINQGGGVFSSQTVSAPANASFFGYADCDDLNSDGLKDIVVGFNQNFKYGVAVYLQDQSGNFNFFQNLEIYTGPSGNNSSPDYIQIADANNDGKKDIVCFKTNGDPIALIYNDSVFEPTQRSHALAVTNLTDKSASFTLQKGNGNGRIAIIRESSSKKSAPSDGIFYANNAQWGVGAQIGSANYVIFRGDSTSMRATGLKEGTTYILSAYEYSVDSKNTIINYLTSASDSVVFTTKKNQTITVPTITDKSADIPFFMLTASASSTLSVIYKLNSGNVSIKGDSVIINGPGPVKITVSQPGSSVYLPAPDVVINFCVNPVRPTIKVKESQPGHYVLSSSSRLNNQWMLSDTPIIGAIDSTFVPILNGIYSVKINVAGCSSTSQPSPFILTATEKTIDVAVYPNPAQDVLFIRGDVDVQTVECHSVDAKILPVSHYETGEYSFVDISSLTAGVYVLHVKTSERIHTIKFLKN